jgi:hypothetical protein
VLKDKIVEKQDLEILFQDLDTISNDLSQYVNFLVKRQCLIQQVMLEDPSCLN